MRLTSRRIGIKELAGLGVLLAAVIFTLLLLSAAPAKADHPLGHKHQFQGRIDGIRGTYIGFDQKGKKGLKKFGMVAPIACGDVAGGNIIPFPIFSKRIPVKYPKGSKTGKFSIKLDVRDAGVKLGTIKINGTRKGKVLKGTISVSVNLGPPGRCFTGVMKWKAKRGAKVNSQVSMI